MDNSSPFVDRHGADEWTFSSNYSFAQDSTILPQIDNSDLGMTITRESEREALSVLAKVMGANGDPNHNLSRQQILSHLNDLTVELHDESDEKKMEILMSSSKIEPMIQLLRYAIYLSSNNLLPNDRMEDLVRWVSSTGSERALDLVLSYKTPTTTIFGENLLVSAARIGCFKIVQCLIKNGIDVNAVTDDWVGPATTALEQAVKESHLQIMHLLLNSGANAEPKAGSSHSILHHAIRVHHTLDVIRTLIDKGADVNAKYEKYGESVLACAAEKGDRALIRTLVRAGAEINETFTGCMTALQVATKFQNIEVVKTLIDSGADVDAPSEDEIEEAFEDGEYEWDFDCLKTPIQLASQVNSVELVRILISEGADLNACPLAGLSDPSREIEDDEVDSYLTALQAATEEKCTVIIRILLEAGAEIDARGYSGDTPLQIGANASSAEISEILLKHGADVNAPASPFYQGRTALQAAASSGDRQFVQQMLDAGANINAIAGQNHGFTALQAAVKSGNADLVEMLIDIGADINAPASDSGGRTCLQAAVKMERIELVDLLLRRGAAVNSPAAAVADGATSLQAALHNFGYKHKSIAEGKDKCRQILFNILNAGADINAPPSPKGGFTALQGAVRCRDPDLVCLLLRMGANPNQHTSEETALGTAVNTGCAQMVSLMIDAGADIHAWYSDYYSSWEGSCWTALHAAAMNGDLPILSKLINAGGDVNYLPQSCSGTPLHYAVKYGHNDVANFLLAKGANPNSRSPGSDNPHSILEEALYTTDINLEVISKLIQAGAVVHKTLKYCSPLKLAAARNTEAVPILLGAGALRGLTHNEGCEVLGYPIQSRNFGLVKLLLDAGVSVNGPIHTHHWTPLQVAAKAGDGTMLQLILSHGADVNASPADDHGASALQAAAIYGHLKIVLTLLKAGANINAPPAKIHGRTALEGAAENGCLDIVHLLLANDDEPERLDARCKRAADCAAKTGHRVIEKILREFKGPEGVQGR